MNFLLQVHRSIVDPAFYREVLSYSRLRVAAFLLKLLLLSTIVTSVAQTYYIIDRERGVPSMIDALFGGMVIDNGVLDPQRSTPYSPRGFMVLPLLERVLGGPQPFSSRYDSLLVVDTSSAVIDSVVVPTIYLRSREVTFAVNPGLLLHIPYSSLIRAERFVVSAESVRRYLLDNVGGVFLTVLAWRGPNSLALMAFSIFFLAVASFIFRMERTTVFRRYFRIACFASTPIPLGGTLVAISGVQLPWTWHVLIFAATIVMFRAVVGTGSGSTTGSESAEE